MGGCLGNGPAATVRALTQDGDTPASAAICAAVSPARRRATHSGERGRTVIAPPHQRHAPVSPRPRGRQRNDPWPANAARLTASSLAAEAHLQQAAQAGQGFWPPIPPFAQGACTCSAIPPPTPICNDYICYMRSLRDRTDQDLVGLANRIRQERLRRKGQWRTCEACQTEFLARAGARFCSGRCRTTAHRRRTAGAA
jgi:hypothetical protein